jgi:hypothetical protein
MPKTSGSFKKGTKVHRPKGVPNKATRDIKQAYQTLIENNLDNLTRWLNQIAKDNPEKAIGIMMGLSEYVIPKLGRIDADITTKGKELNQSPYDLSKLSVKALKELQNAKTD